MRQEQTLKDKINKLMQESIPEYDTIQHEVAQKYSDLELEEFIDTYLIYLKN